MFLKTKTFLTFFLVLSAVCSCGVADTPPGGTGDEKSGELTVALNMDMPGYFKLGEESFGYPYDLLRAYAAHRRAELKVITGNTASECASLLERGKADIVLSLDRAEAEPASPAVYTTSYTVLVNKRNHSGIKDKAGLAVGEVLRGKKVLIPEGFKISKDYKNLTDLFPECEVYVSSRGSLELAEALRDGYYDVMVCEKTESHVISALISGIVSIHDLSGTVSVNAAFGENSGRLGEDFSQWLDTYRASKDYAVLTQLYFEKGIAAELLGKSSGRLFGSRISEYDRVMKEVCGREGVDWRLMSAIAYNESRFNAHVESPRGAKGLMQIMPSTARQFDVPLEDLSKPDVNIMLAAKLLAKIEEALKLPGNIAYKDKMSIVLACYNCGIGHVMDARRLAAKYGGSPDSWRDVSAYLQKKGYAEFAGDEAVKCGPLRESGHTLAFVNNVMGKYDSYCIDIQK